MTPATQIEEPLTAETIAALIDDRPAEGIFRVHRDAFRDARIFELEQRAIFESTWVFVGLAARAPNPHDYFTSSIGRVPVAVMRGADGTLRCAINSCRHKGALICRSPAGNAQVHTCSYHSWAYDSNGRNVGIKARAAGGYLGGFDRLGHDLIAVPRFEDYRGFLFASLNAGVAPLREHLGGITAFLDLVVDQSPDGVETVPGDVTFTYDGNWKLQLENCSDGYHFTSVHASYLKIAEARAAAAAGGSRMGEMFNQNTADRRVGMFGFDNGHSAVWTAPTDPALLPLADAFDEIRARVGAARAKWMCGVRNITLFPNMQIADNASIQLRIIRPLAVNRTAVETYCLAPVGESTEARRKRVRQYIEFFNPAGLATPDDATCYEDCERGNRGTHDDWFQGYMRGASDLESQPNAQARELGIEPASGAVSKLITAEETTLHAGYRRWVSLLCAAVQQ